MNIKILFVDDERGVLTVASLFIKALGYDILLANSGEEAINSLQETGCEIKIIFLDLMMPNIDGLGVLNFMQKKKINIPTIVQTGMLDDISIKEAKELGAVDYITKPYTREDIGFLINKYIKENI